MGSPDSLKVTQIDVNVDNKVENSDICCLVHVILLSRRSCASDGGETAGLPVRDSPGTA